MYTILNKIKKGEKIYPEEYRKACIDRSKNCLKILYDEGGECDILLKMAEEALSSARKTNKEIMQTINKVRSQHFQREPKNNGTNNQTLEEEEQQQGHNKVLQGQKSKYTQEGLL